MKYVETFIQTILKEHDALIVGSVDFSHYVTAEVAAQRDTVTKALIATQAYEDLLAVNYEYCDSPATVVAVLRSLGATADSITVHAEKNLVDYLPYNPGVVAETTSYIVYSVD